MENELSTDAIGIPPRSESGDVSKQNETRNTLDRSKSELTFTSHGTGCPQTNNQCQSETLKKQIHSEDTNAVRNDNYVVSSDDLLNHDYRRSQNVRNACGLGHNHPKLSEEFAVNSGSTEPKIRTPNIFKQTQDKNAPDQTLSYLKLPYEHPETHETCCAQTNIESQSETLEKTFQPANTNVIRNENTLHPNHYDGGQSVQNAGEFRHDHPKMSKEFEINSESTVPKIKYQEEVEKTPDKNALDQTPSNLRLPPEPPLEWRLNELLDDIAMELTKSEFERIKLLFTGPESLGEDLLKECDTCIKLFTVLKEKRYISRDNILYLNKILYILRRIDLINRTVEYCHEEGNVIHYYSFDREPGSGKRYVKIHVVADVHNYNKEALDQLRNCVAYIVCAPIEVVVISAVEPGSSFLITFTIPDIYVDVLKELLQRKVNLGRLSSLQVDIVIVDDVHFDVSGQAAEKMLTEQYKKIRNVYEQLNDKRKELEQLNITHVQCLEELKSVKLQLERTEKVNLELTSTCSILQKFHMASNVTDAALDGFQSLMKEASDQGQNMGLIQKIIKSKTEITAAYHRSVNEMKQEGQILKLQERKMNDEMFLRELSWNLKSPEESLHTKYSQNTLAQKCGMDPDVDVDALAVPATAEQEDFRLGDDLFRTWSFSFMIHEVAKNISQEELEKIKELCRGSLGRGLLHKCDTCIQLIDVLRMRGYISTYNILYLNKILYSLGRRDLIKMTEEYCLKERNIIHYHSFDGEPGSGQRYAKIHVVADVQKYNKETLDKFRKCVAEMVGVPIEVVEISAVEPGSLK